MGVRANRHVIGWPVSEEVCKRAAMRRRINVEGVSWLSSLISRINARKGLDVRIRMLHPKVAKEDEQEFFFAFYQGYEEISEAEAGKILSQLPPSIKEEFGLVGEPRHSIANDSHPLKYV